MPFGGCQGWNVVDVDGGGDEEDALDGVGGEEGGGGGCHWGSGWGDLRWIRMIQVMVELIKSSDRGKPEY